MLVGVGRDDEPADAEALADKVVNLRIFEDEAGKMNLDLLAAGGAVLAISQFTLLGDVRKGRRPSFSEAMEPVGAQALFEAFCAACRKLGVDSSDGPLPRRDGRRSNQRRPSHDPYRQQARFLDIAFFGFGDPVLDLAFDHAERLALERPQQEGHVEIHFDGV